MLGGDAEGRTWVEACKKRKAGSSARDVNVESADQELRANLGRGSKLSTRSRSRFGGTLPEPNVLARRNGEPHGNNNLGALKSLPWDPNDERVCELTST